MSRLFVAAAFLTLVGAAPASAATVATDLKCYIEQQPMQIGGTGWGPGTGWSVSGGGSIFDSGIADPAGNWLSNTQTAPIVVDDTTTPETVTLTATQDDAPVAETTFKVVNFLVLAADPNGNPRGKTRFSFSGFTPGKTIYIHVKRGDTWTQKVKKAKSPCGTANRRLRRLPAVPARKIRSGTYKLYVDSKRKFSKKTRPQYRASITITTIPTFG